MEVGRTVVGGRLWLEKLSFGDGGRKDHSVVTEVGRTIACRRRSLIENLSTPSILSKCYRTLPSEEASAVARRIDQEAFDLASTYANAALATKDSGKVSDSVPKHTEPTSEDITSGESEPSLSDFAFQDFHFLPGHFSFTNHKEFSSGCPKLDEDADGEDHDAGQNREDGEHHQPHEKGPFNILVQENGDHEGEPSEETYESQEYADLKEDELPAA
ncbi:hypothetical protein IEQ34_007254 [Dendrobium chrysotoxum]|uniref:WPP domain-containing protein n=1 Tax=Dendrobium chrysotoxum TaxID=161865 RepID=A0AAV7HA69_DENCH|nr:hypothetical protein IEQ34_007254 [Dendrobium chrysotoxum]